jgi:DNA-binding HxlR family transcriptional regulator
LQKESALLVFCKFIWPFSEMGIKSAKMNKKLNSQRRSPCPVSCALEIFGDRWTLLVIRDLILGKSRFKEFLASPEGIPTNILTDRLKRLLFHEIASQVSGTDGSRHLAYALTDKGHALTPIVRAMKDWGLAWEKGTATRLTAPQNG